MLHELIDFGVQRDLVIQAGFKAGELKWMISLDQNGGFLDLIQSKQEFKAMPEAPNAYKTTGQIKSGFLVESFEVIASWNKISIDPNKAEKILKKSQYFLGLFKEAVQAAPKLQPIIRFLESTPEKAKLIQKLENLGCKGSEQASFIINEYVPLGSDDWRSWWLSHLENWSQGPRFSRKTTSAGNMVCVASGQNALPVLSHDPIAGYPSKFGVRGSGDRLVSFDKAAFRSFDLPQSKNAAMSQDSVNAYRKVMAYLINKQAQKLGPSLVTYWYKGLELEARQDPIRSLFDSNEEADEPDANIQARKTLKAAIEGKVPEKSEYRYCLLVLGRSEARVVIRDWMEGSLQNLAGAVSRWLDDVAIFSLAGARKSYGLESYVTCLLNLKTSKQKYADWVKPLGGIQEELLKAAISEKRKALPRSLLGILVPKMKAFFLGKSWQDCLDDQSANKRERPRLLAMLYARMGLLKAYFISTKGESFMKDTVNPDHPAAEYHCGRLLAVLSALQTSALDEVGAGVVQRFYGSASQTPRTVLGALVRNSNHHLAKLEGGLKHWYQSRIAEIMARLGDDLPRTLTLEQQSLFALGFYQQMAHDRAGKSAKNHDQQTQEVTQ